MERGQEARTRRERGNWLVVLDHADLPSRVITVATGHGPRRIGRQKRLAPCIIRDQPHQDSRRTERGRKGQRDRIISAIVGRRDLPPDAVLPKGRVACPRVAAGQWAGGCRVAVVPLEDSDQERVAGRVERAQRLFKNPVVGSDRPGVIVAGGRIARVAADEPLRQVVSRLRVSL